MTDKLLKNIFNTFIYSNYANLYYNIYLFFYIYGNINNNIQT